MGGGKVRVKRGSYKNMDVLSIDTCRYSLYVK